MLLHIVALERCLLNSVIFAPLLNPSQKRWLTPTIPHSVLSLRGAIYLAMGNIKEAENDFAKASQIDPENEDNIELLGLCYLHKGDPKKAEGYFQRIVGQYRYSISGYVGLAYLRITKSLYAEARKY